MTATGPGSSDATPHGGGVPFREVTADRAPEYVDRGGHQRDFFAHRIYYLPKPGPDGFRLARRMVRGCRLDQLWEAALYADAGVIAEFPPDLFFDPDLIWHQQHLGRPGLVATANLVTAGDRLYSMVHISDLVQRISRRREHKTRVENRFHGWDRLLVNAVLNFALERGLRTVYMPSADLAICHTDPTRSPERELFERVYDRHVVERLSARRDGDWWRVDVADNRDRVLRPVARTEPLPAEKIVCLCHDIERGFGHRDVDPHFADRAHIAAQADLPAMLAIERDAGVRATYNVVGAFLDEVRGAIEADGHTIGFHSFDHRTTPEGLLARLSGAGGRLDREQLDRCRTVDYRIRGYRPPRSRLSTGLSDERLCFHNFEWLASSSHSLGFAEPRMRGRLVKIPIGFDDWPMHARRVPYDVWEREALASIERSSFVALSMHDCYAPYWLEHYPRFLDAVGRLGVLRTLDEVANREILRHAG